MGVETSVEERELVDRCISGDEAAWRQFVQRYQERLTAYARTALASMRQPPTEADEIVGRVLAQLIADDYRALRTFRWQCSMAGWLRILARTACVRAVRRKQLPAAALERAPASPEPLDRLLSDEARELVRKALAELPARERDLLTMFFSEGRTYEEISARMKIPMGTVATILARTRERLRGILRSKGLVSEARRAERPGR